ncbi:MAG: SCO6880 family protein [Acidimicrobiales bacterium]
MTVGRTYRLVGRDGTGVFLGLGVTEIVLVGSGFAAAVLGRLAGAPAVAAAVPLLVGCGLAKMRIGGRAAYQWLPLLAGWAAAAATGRRRWRASLRLASRGDEPGPDLPAALRGLEIVDLAGASQPFAAIQDRRSARLTVVLPVRVERFVGAEPSTQEALLSAWGDVLSAQATSGSPVVQLGWSQQTRPAGLAAHRTWLDELAGSPGSSAGRRGYSALVDEVAALAAEHDTVVWATVSGRGIPGRGSLLSRAMDRLPAAVAPMAAALGDASVEVGAGLTVGQLWRLLGLRADPNAAPCTGGTASLAARMGLAAPTSGAPLAMEVHWSEVQVDGSWHRIYWVESWPRRPVPTDWLVGFLSEGEPVTTTVAYHPIDPARSQRRIDGQLVKLGAHRARQENKARRVSEIEHRTEQAVHDLEAELASGYAEVLYLGLVCVTGRSFDDLEARCQAVEQAARTAQLGLRVLHGRQDVAWAATLPFGLIEPGLVEVTGL